MLQIVTIAAATAILLFLVGIGPARWLLPPRLLGLWPFFAFFMGMISLALLGDVLGSFWSVDRFAWPLLAVSGVAAIASFRRPTPRDTLRASPLTMLIVAAIALVALAYGMAPLIAEARLAPHAVTNHDFFTYNVIADRLRHRAYFDWAPLLTDSPGFHLESYFQFFVFICWRVGLVYVEAFLSTIVDRPDYLVFGVTNALAFGLWPVATFLWARLALPEDSRGISAAIISLINSGPIFLVSEAFNAQMWSLSLALILSATLLWTIGSRRRRGIVLNAVLAAGWLAIFADGGLLVLILMASSGVAVVAGERHWRSAGLDLLATALWTVLLAPNTFVRGGIAAWRTIGYRLADAASWDETWRNPPWIDFQALFLGASAEGAVRGGIIPAMPIAGQLAIMLAVTFLLCWGFWGAPRVVKWHCGLTLPLLVGLALFFKLGTNVGYLVSKTLLTASAFVTALTCLAWWRPAGADQNGLRCTRPTLRHRLTDPRWLVGIAFVLGAVGVVRSGWLRLQRPNTVSAAHESVERAVAQLPVNATLVLTGTDQYPGGVLDEHSLVYLLESNGRFIHSARHPRSYLTYLDLPTQWFIPPDRPLYSIELASSDVVATGPLVWQNPVAAIRRVDTRQPYGRWRFDQGWYAPELDDEQRWRFFHHTATLRLVTTNPNPFGRLVFEARRPEQVGPRLLEVAANGQTIFFAPIHAGWTTVMSEPWPHESTNKITLRTWGPDSEVSGRPLAAAVRDLRYVSTNQFPTSYEGAWGAPERDDRGDVRQFVGEAVLRVFPPNPMRRRLATSCLAMTLHIRSDRDGIDGAEIVAPDGTTHSVALGRDWVSVALPPVLIQDAIPVRLTSRVPNHPVWVREPDVQLASECVAPADAVFHFRRALDMPTDRPCVAIQFEARAASADPRARLTVHGANSAAPPESLDQWRPVRLGPLLSPDLLTVRLSLSSPKNDDQLRLRDWRFQLDAPCPSPTPAAPDPKP